MSVMQNRSIRSRGTNWGIGKLSAPASRVSVEMKHTFQLILHHPCLHAFHNRQVGRTVIVTKMRIIFEQEQKNIEHTLVPVLYLRSNMVQGEQDGENYLLMAFTYFMMACSSSLLNTRHSVISSHNRP